VSSNNSMGAPPVPRLAYPVVREIQVTGRIPG
jgi:hypothetical protein